MFARRFYSWNWYICCVIKWIENYNEKLHLNGTFRIEKESKHSFLGSNVHNATHVSIVHPKTESGAWNFSILHMHWSSPNWHNIYRTAIAFRWKSILLPEQQNESAKDWKSLEIQTIDSIFLHSLKRAWNAEMGKCVRRYQWSKRFFFKRTHYPSHFNKAITYLNHENGIAVVGIDWK